MQLPKELQFIVNGRKPQKRTTARLDGKTCIITGATSGVGLAAARRIAKGGANLVIVCRNQEKASKVQEEIEAEHDNTVDIILADFSQLNQVRKAAEEIILTYPKIDILINNIGIHNTTRQLIHGVEMVFLVNHLAPFLFTRLLIEHIKDSAPARILYVNSQGHRFNGLDLHDLEWNNRRYMGLLSYGASKTAQLMTIWDLTKQLEGTGVTVNAMHPGGVTTNIGMNNGFLYRSYQRYILFPFLSDPKISGEAIYYLIASPEMVEVSGKFFNQTIEETPAAHAMNRETGRKLWEISEELTGLKHVEEDHALN